MRQNPLYNKDYFNKEVGNTGGGKFYQDYSLAQKVQEEFYKNLLKVGFFKDVDSVLDIGCAYGYLLNNLGKDFRVPSLGIDISDYAINKAKEINPGIDFAVGDLNEGLNLNNESFSHIILLDVIEHLESPYKSLLELKRLLKPKGRLVIRTPNIESLEFFIRRKRFFYFKDKTHLYLFGHLSLKNILEKAGFKIIMKGSDFYPLPFLKNITFGGSIWLIAEKD